MLVTSDTTTDRGWREPRQTTASNNDGRSFMIHDTRLLISTLMVISFAFAGIRQGEAAIANVQDNGLTEGNSYVSPTFGYTIEWTDSWDPLPDATIVSDEGDVLGLTSIEHGTRVTVTSTPASATPSQAIADAYLQSLQASHEDLKLIEPTENDAWKDAPAYLVTYDLEPGIPVDDYFEARGYGSAMILSDARIRHPSGSLLTNAIASELTLDGAPLFAYLGSVEGTTTYESPTFGSTTSYDPGLWSVNEEKSAAENNGRDLIVLERSDLSARIYIENYEDYNGDANRCLDAASAEAVGDLDQADLMQDENGFDITGESNGGAWAAYAFESDSGDALAAFIECLSLPDTPGVLVFTLITLEDSFNEAYIAATEILDSIELQGATTKSGDQQTGPRPSPDRNNDEIGERN
jgi:hypothetical protein